MERLIALLLITTPLTPKNPLLAAERVDETFSAVVVHAWLAGGYTYLELERGDGQHVNAVTLGDAPAAGAVDVRAYARANNFTSKRLGRRFDSLLFAAVHPKQELHE